MKNSATVTAGVVVRKKENNIAYIKRYWQLYLLLLFPMILIQPRGRSISVTSAYPSFPGAVIGSFFKNLIIEFKQFS